MRYNLSSNTQARPPIVTDTYYDSLRVPPDADQDAIATAYLRLRDQHHPRNSPDDPLAAEVVRYLDAAYAVLIDPTRRSAYDEALRNGHAAGVALTAEAEQLVVAHAEPEPARVPPPGFLSRTFTSLAIRDYRLLLSGNIITQFGTWFQNIGMNWLVFVVTGSALAMAALAGWRGIITLLLSPFGGVWADRLDRRTLMIAFTFVSALEATALAVLVYTGWILPGAASLDDWLAGTALSFFVTSGITKAWVFFLFALVDGVVNSVAQPTRQAFVYDVAGHEQVANAIALNASFGNTARVVGPNLAAYIIGFFGVHWAFIVRAGSIWTALNFTLRITPKPRAQPSGERRESIFRAVAEGFRYVRHDRLILGLLLAEVLLPFLIYPYFQFLPIFAKDVLHGDVRAYGALASGGGAGNIVGGLLIAGLTGIRRKGLLMLVTSACYIGGVLLFTRSTVLALSFGLLVVTGFFHVITTTLVQALIQLHVRSDVRGRTLSLYTMGQSALQPLGALSLGAAIAILGPQDGVAAFTLLGLAGLTVIALLIPEIRKV